MLGVPRMPEGLRRTRVEVINTESNIKYVEVLEMISAYELVDELCGHLEAGTEVNQQSLLNTLDIIKADYLIVYQSDDFLGVDIFPDPTNKHRSFVVEIEDNKVINIEERHYLI